MQDTCINYISYDDLLKSIAENKTTGTTQFKSIKNPKIRFPNKAPPRPNVNDKAAAITLLIDNNNNFIIQLWELSRKI